MTATATNTIYATKGEKVLCVNEIKQACVHYTIQHNYLCTSDRNHMPRNCCASMCDSDEKANDQKYTWTCKEDYAGEDKAEDLHASNI